jgi:TPR repeat protein
MQGCKKFIFSVLIVSLSLLQGCVAHNAFLYDQGVQYYSYEQYNRAFILFIPLARSGDPDAQYAVAYLYYYGLGVVEDPLLADYWLNQAALQGQPMAICALQNIDRGRAIAMQKPLQPVTIY